MKVTSANNREVDMNMNCFTLCFQFFGLAMGEDVSKWRVFSGLQSSMFPVELFLALVETESASLSTNVCEEAWHRIDPGMDTPAGVWRAAMASKYEAMFRNDLPVRQVT